jgi:hypothetical protein
VKETNGSKVSGLKSTKVNKKIKVNKKNFFSTSLFCPLCIMFIALKSVRPSSTRSGKGRRTSTMSLAEFPSEQALIQSQKRREENFLLVDAELRKGE